MAQWSERQRLKLDALGSIPGGCPVLFTFSQLTCTSLRLQNWMMSMSALVQVATITDALVQFGRSSTVGCYHQCSSTGDCYHY